MRAALTRAARGDAALSRPPAAGLPELQSWFAHELGASTPAGTTPPNPSDVVVLPGSQSGLSSIFTRAGGPRAAAADGVAHVLGRHPGRAQAGVRVVPVPSGPDGPDPAELARAFDETGARLFYAQPNYANPTGAQWAAGGAKRSWTWCAPTARSWWRTTGRTTSASPHPVPVASRDDSGHVVYLRSLTKSVSPAIRIAAVIARGPGT